MTRLLVLALFLMPACKVTDDRGNPCPSGQTVWDTSSDKGACWRQCYAYGAAGGGSRSSGIYECIRYGCGYERVCVK